MNRDERLSRGWALISEGAQELSLAYASTEQPPPLGTTAAGPVSPAGSEGAASSEPPRTSPPTQLPPSLDDLPAEEFVASWDEGEPAPDYEEESQVVRQRGATYRGATCPAHGIAWLKGKYGLYCPSTAEDPKWSNQRGYCSLTPRNAAKWLEMHRNAA